MESIAELGGGSSSIACNLCLLCQKTSNETTSVLGLTGWERITSCSELRKELLDRGNAVTIQRIASIKSFGNDKYVYHRSCYEKFTNKSKIERLRKVQQDATKLDSSRTLRSDISTVLNKNLCIVCQVDKDCSNLRNASTYAINQQLERVACFDYALKRCMAYAFDAMAGDVRYHTYCLVNKEKQLERRTKNETDANVSFLQLCFELHAVAAKGQVVTLEAVFQRYTKLALEVHEDMPSSYVTRRYTFREALQKQLGGVFQFYKPFNRDINERGTLLIPHSYNQMATVNMVYEGESEIPKYVPKSDSAFKELVHVALKIRGDLKAAVLPGKHGINISKEDSEAIAPESLFMLLSLVFGGNDALDNVQSIIDDSHECIGNTNTHSNRILSLAQDFVYVASKGRQLTPKHIGLGLTLHQKTRSRELVTLFNKAGHCASYEQVLQLETAMGQVSLGSMDPVTGCVVPVNLIRAEEPLTPETPISSSSLLHATADNVDIQMDTLDGKRSFHGTQMVIFQRGAKSMDDSLRAAVRSKERSLKLTKAISNIIPPTITSEKPEPVLNKPAIVQWYRYEEPPIGVQKAESLDVGFLLHRGQGPTLISWTEFNKNVTENEPCVSNAGYMPLILQPAHEMSTLHTVLLRCLYLADQVHHYYITLTVDQQLHCKLLELMWANATFRSRIILRLGGLHISMNFLKAIGQHMSCSGLSHAWIESGIISEASAAKIEDDKAYGKGMRIHKLTFQALWRVMEPEFLKFLAEQNPKVFEDITAARGDISQILLCTRRHNVLNAFAHFVSEQNNVNMTYWWSDMEMVLTLLQFTRSIREGVWDLYKASLTEMLPWMARYDHNNYFKSMSVYISDMNQLPQEVEAAFKRGEFVVKKSPGKFNQVDPDHAQEWTVADAKDSSGIVGIIQKDAALQRWSLAFSWRGDICNKTKQLLGLKCPTSSLSLNPARRKRDQEDEENLKRVLSEFDFCDLQHPNELRNIATKDVATKLVQESLLQAKHEGMKQVVKFVEMRLGTEKSMSFHSTVTLNRAATFASMYKANSQTKALAKSKKIREDRGILQRVIVAFEAGRAVDLPHILTHELFDVPLSLANPDGSLRSGSKSDIFKIMTSELTCPAKNQPERNDSHLIIDGQALVQRLGATTKAKTFTDFSNHVRENLKLMGKHYSRVDVVFDRYDRVSTKAGTRVKRVAKSRPIRKNIDSGNVPFPQNWGNFVALPDNKAELALFLSKEIIAHPISQLEVAVAGGFQDGQDVASTCPDSDLSNLRATHEEADTRVILHAIYSPYRNVVVSARDTDIFLLLLHHFQSTRSMECWMMAGTTATQRFVPIHEAQKVFPPSVIRNVLAFLAIIGCDTTSHLAGIGEAKAFRILKENADLLSGVGVEPLSDSALQRAEEFVVKLYGITKVKIADGARHLLFSKVKKPEDLPPTSDALHQHIRRAHYQATIWHSANIAAPKLPEVTNFGWRLEEGQLKPVFCSKETVPKACISLVSCGCEKGCRTRQCKCRRTVDSSGSHLQCASFCRCQGDCSNGKEDNLLFAAPESSDDDPDDDL